MSNEVDAAQRALTSDLAQLEVDRQRYQQADSIARNARRKLGLQIIDILEARGIESDNDILMVSE